MLVSAHALRYRATIRQGEQRSQTSLIDNHPTATAALAIDISALGMISSASHQEWPENRARQPGMDAQGA